MIKTWKERIKPEYHSVDRFAMAGMQAEIDELRSENARLRDALNEALEFLEFAWRDISMNEFSSSYLDKTVEAARAALGNAGDKPPQVGLD